MSTEDLIASVIPWLHSINQSIGKISAAFGLASEAGAGGAVHHEVGLASEAGGAVNHVGGEVVKVAAVAALAFWGAQTPTSLLSLRGISY